MARNRTSEKSTDRRGPSWLPWLLAAALLAVLIGVALHFSSWRDFVELTRKARPWWVVLAALLQVATYYAQGEVWRLVGREARSPLSIGAAFELSLAKLFVDQALPTAGVSGNILAAKALGRRGMRKAVANAVVLVNVASYHLIYALCLAVALGIAVARKQVNLPIILASVLFLAYGTGVTVAIVTRSGRGDRGLIRHLSRLPVLGALADFLKDAEPRLAGSRRLLLEASGLQLAIVLLDAATLWILIRAMGATASFPGVFASFMFASLLRTIGIVPGGLGVFEAASVVTLKMAGVGIPVGLSATLLFRGLTFWLPMLPGIWLSRRVVARAPSGRRRGAGRGAAASRTKSRKEGGHSEEWPPRKVTERFWR